MKVAPLVCLAMLVSGAFAQPMEVERNEQVFGSSVRTATTVKGDFSAVGGRVVLDRAVADDALLMGGTVDVLAPVGEDLRAVGGDISVESSVGGDVLAAAGTLRLTNAAQVGGRAELAGGDVLIDGRVNGSLNVHARRLVLNGPVGGDVQVSVEQLELGSKARVDGGLRYTASTFTQDPAAVVTGPLQRVERHNMHEDRRPAMSGWWLLMPLSMGLLGVLALGGAMLFVFSRFAVQAAHHIETEPWRTLGLGAVLLLALPVLSLLLFFTLLGIPLGMLVMAIYPPLLLLGWLIGALFAARWLASLATPDKAKSSAVPYGWMAVAVLALLVLGALPVVGQLLVTATMAAGLGACVLEWRRRLASRSESAA